MKSYKRVKKSYVTQLTTTYVTYFITLLRRFYKFTTIKIKEANGGRESFWDGLGVEFEAKYILDFRGALDR